MVHLTKIYTKTGDSGETSLGDGSRIYKTAPRLNAYATVDEANSYIGVVISLGEEAVDREIIDALLIVQNDLFDLGADVSTPLAPENKQLRITSKQVAALETYIDFFNSTLNPLRSFVLPSGTPAAAHLHVARTIVRRAEREVWGAIQNGEDLNVLTAVYLNRLSDLLFVFARFANRRLGDKLWVPGGKA